MEAPRAGWREGERPKKAGTELVQLLCGREAFLGDAARVRAADDINWVRVRGWAISRNDKEDGQASM